MSKWLTIYIFSYVVYLVVAFALAGLLICMALRRQDHREASKVQERHLKVVK